MNSFIKFFPVGNADCSLIKLSNGMTIIVDCQINPAFDDEGNQVCYDVKSDLSDMLAKDDEGRQYVDLFINTHPHKDHCLGFGDNFYCGSLDDYDAEKDKDKIVIGELWITNRGIGNDIDSSAEDIRREAKRRRKLYDDDSNYKGEYSNYLRIVGYDDQKEYDSRYGYVPGTFVKAVNGKDLDYLEIFIHAPFKEDVNTAKGDGNKNMTSIVAQYRFRAKKDSDIVTRILLGGDAEHPVWKHIIENNKDDDTINWNLFEAPHHCSWTFFNDSSKKDEVQPTSIDILEKQLGKDAYIVTSSEEIKDDDDENPLPSYRAKTEYKAHLKTKGNFLNTATDKTIDGIPQPIVFNIDSNGLHKQTESTIKEKANAVANAMKCGKLGISGAGLLSTLSSKAIASSGGFYGEDA